MQNSLIQVVHIILLPPRAQVRHFSFVVSFRSLSHLGGCLISLHHQALDSQSQGVEDLDMALFLSHWTESSSSRATLFLTPPLSRILLLLSLAFRSTFTLWCSLILEGLLLTSIPLHLKRKSALPGAPFV